MSSRWKHAAIAVVLLVASACGGGDDGATASTTSQPARIIATTIPVATVPVTASVLSETTVAPTTAVATVSNYTVQSGDALSLIAQRFGVSSADIMSLNNLTNADQLEVGQVLVIPSPGAVATAPAASSDSTDSAPAAAVDGEAYVVGDGESLGFIAIKFGTTVEAIVAANGISDPDRVAAGDSLVIPAG